MRRTGTLRATAVFVLAASVLAAAPAGAAPGDLGNSGTQTTDFGGGTDVAVQADGKIVVSGAAGGDFALVRYNADGSLDTTFSGDGMQTADFGGASDGANGIAVQADGKIVAAGAGGDHGDFALVRYNADGSPDTTFSYDGKQTTDFGGASDGANGIAIRADGKIVAGGTGGGRLALARYNADGSPDTTFSDDGKQTAALASARDVAVQPDGKIVAVGGYGDFVLLRFNGDGAPDTTFSGDGEQTTDLDGADQVSGVAIQPDGKIVAAGSAGGGIYFALARYNADGSLDPTFSGDGKQIPIFGGGLWGEYATAVAIQPNGKIVAVGHCCDSDIGGAFAVAGLNSDGSLDASWANNGRATTAFDGDASARAVAIQPDGGILAAGGNYPASGGPAELALARYQGLRDEFAAVPTNTAAPTISGTTIEGQTLTAVPGGWSGTQPITVADAWRRCDSIGASCVYIATGSTYTLTGSDVGHTIRVRETATNYWGHDAVDTSATAVVTAKPQPGKIAGTVRNVRNGARIAKASVNCGSGYSAKTTSSGDYSIVNVAPGTYTCTASASGYQASTMNPVVVSAGQTTTANFSLART
jgi:uncharacterized delta-60 repeat protein